MQSFPAAGTTAHLDILLELLQLLLPFALVLVRWGQAAENHARTDGTRVSTANSSHCQNLEFFRVNLYWGFFAC